MKPATRKALAAVRSSLQAIEQALAAIEAEEPATIYPPTEKRDDYLTKRELMSRYKVTTPDLLRRWRQRKGFPNAALRGLWSRREVEAWEARTRAS